MSFFAELAALTRDLLRPDTEGGIGAAQGSIVLKRITPGTPNSEEPWVPVEPTTETQVLRAHSFGVPQKFVDGVTILTGDQYVISEVPALDWKQGEDGAVVCIELDGIDWQVVGAQDIPSAGTRAAVKFMVRK